jgi:hypothetical protein
MSLFNLPAANANSIFDNELDVISAIEAHIRWKIRLESYINGTSDEQLDATVVAKDDQCALGKWIYENGQRFSHLGQFADLKKTHAEFHRCAAAVICEADKGDRPHALKMLNEGEYAKCSYRVKTMLARVCREAHL